MRDQREGEDQGHRRRRGEDRRPRVRDREPSGRVRRRGGRGRQPEGADGRQIIVNSNDSSNNVM